MQGIQAHQLQSISLQGRRSAIPQLQLAWYPALLTYTVLLLCTAEAWEGGECEYGAKAGVLGGGCAVHGCHHWQ